MIYFALLAISAWLVLMLAFKITVWGVHLLLLVAAFSFVAAMMRRPNLARRTRP